MIIYNVQNKFDFDRDLKNRILNLRLEDDSEKKLFRDEIFEVQGAIERHLKLKWHPDDFSVGWDFNYCRFTCGGIYSEKIFSYEYIKTIAIALNEIDKNGI